ncbi:MAG: glycerol-3-phosphate 1-O-acyltransferase PlsY [Myxococcales bacterium FL481]|nr:MAG: glycerol-3-phosphate 1-O-acyltransferase PlsY [Myxococcales bacterium FL481]
MLNSLVAWSIFAYLLAAVPMGVLVGRARGIDLRSVGSGNIGATNAVRALGAKWGLVVFALDVLKAALPVWLAAQSWALGETPSWPLTVVALAAFIGHVFPIYLGFRGGKGVACALGVVLVLHPVAAVLGLLLYVQTLALVRVSAVASLTGATVMAAVAWATSSDWWICGLISVLWGLVWWRHRSNLADLRARQREKKPAESCPRA